MSEYDNFLDLELERYYSDDEEIAEDDEWLIDMFIEKALQEQEEFGDE